MQHELGSLPLVSVVTPFFNTDRYLAECIQSVLAQSYQRWEYILVNNCSSDESLKIAEHYAAKDGRIRLSTNRSFLTQVENYNHALSLISSESKYCKIVQADDWLFPTCLSEMVKIAESDCSVGIVSSYRLEGEKVSNDGLPYSITIASGREICRSSLVGRYFVFGSPTSIMFRADIVRNRKPFYSENSHHEDTEACYEILQKHDFGFVHQVLTFTRRENDSILAGLWRLDPSHILDRLVAVKKYGPIYLDRGEYEAVLTETEKRYWRFLAESALGLKGREFWEYHESGLAQIAYRFSWIRLSKHILLVLISFSFDSKMLARKLIRFLGLSHKH